MLPDQFSGREMGLAARLQTIPAILLSLTARSTRHPRSRPCAAIPHPVLSNSGGTATPLRSAHDRFERLSSSNNTCSQIQIPLLRTHRKRPANGQGRRDFHFVYSYPPPAEFAPHPFAGTPPTLGSAVIAFGN